MINTDDVRIAHFLPGRVRLKVAALRGNPTHAKRLSDAFAAVPGVRSIECNPLTGGILIHYDSSRIIQTDAAQVLASVMRRELPALDVVRVLQWLGAPPIE
jgi:hypothetical protein